MTATIFVVRGLLSPMPVYGQRFSAMGERAKQLLFHAYEKEPGLWCPKVHIKSVTYTGELEEGGNTPLCHIQYACILGVFIT